MKWVDPAKTWEETYRERLIICYVPQLYCSVTSKRGINFRITKRTLPPREKPSIHTHLKQEKENNNSQYDLLPIVQRIHTQEHHHRYTHQVIMFSRKKKSQQNEDLTNNIDSYKRHWTFISDKTTAPANHGESINVTLVEISGIIRLAKWIRMVKCALLWRRKKVLPQWSMLAIGKLLRQIRTPFQGDYNA